MPLSINSLGGLGSVAPAGFFLDRFTLRAPGGPANDIGLAADATPPATAVARLIELVAQVRDDALDSISGAGSLLARQQSLDTYLAEIADLVGLRLALGGGDNALVEGLDPTQVVGYEVRRLSPNSQASFRGVSSVEASPAQVVIPRLTQLREEGGALSINVGGLAHNFSVRPGSSVDQILVRIGRLSGVTVRRNHDAIELASTQNDGSTPIQVTARYGRSVGADTESVETAAIVSGVSSAQIASVGTGGLAAGASLVVSGTRDTLASAAELFYQGASSTVAGSASFTLTGELGSASIDATRGESLALLAQRINDRASATGVVAAVEGDAIRFYSQATGATATVVIDGVERATSASIDGANPAQVTAVNLFEGPDEFNLTLSGSVTRAADVARQVYEGDASGLVTGDAGFDLTGGLGGARIEITRGESLADVALRVNDLAGSTGVTARVEGTNLYFESAAIGSAASVTLDGVVLPAVTTVTGVNAAQVADFSAVSIDEGAEVTLTGNITRAADYARQTYQGGPGGTVVDSASFTLEGSLGSASITIDQGESLADVAVRINGVSDSTGVQAAAEGDNLVFTSAELGTAHSVRVTLDSITQYYNATGANAAQVTGFTVLSAPPDSVSTLNGSVDQAATRAQLTYQGTGLFGTTGSAATFTLTGQVGSAQISVGGFESMASVRDKINAQTGATGVAATLSGSIVTLSSTGYGSAAIVDVDVNSGTFNTNGGNGQGLASGADALLTLNGQQVTSSGLDVAFTSGLESYTFQTVAGYTGALSTITVTATPGGFDVVGGDAGGLATGVDAAATLNGQSFTAVGDQLSGIIDSLAFSLQTAAGFTGAIDPITVRSEYEDFTVTGGDGAGFAVGVDAQATLNGQSYTAVGRTFALAIDQVTFELTAAVGFAGVLDDITLRSSYDDFSIAGGNGDGAAFGADSTATLNGQTLTSTGSTFTLDTDDGPVVVAFQPAFVGTFDEFTVAPDESPAPTQTNGGSITREFVGTPGSGARVTYNGETLQRDGDFYLLKQAGVEIALRLAPDFRGELSSFTVTAAGEATAYRMFEPLTGADREAALSAINVLFSAATGGDASLIGLDNHKTLLLASEALDSLRSRFGGGSSTARRRLTGGLFDGLA